MATTWKVAAAKAVLGWLVWPIIAFFLTKILSCLVFDPSEKVRQLKIHIIPELQKTLRAVDQAIKLQREEGSDVSTLNDMAVWLRLAQDDAEEIFADALEIELYRNRYWQHLYGATKACSGIVLGESARLLQWTRRNNRLIDLVTAPSCSSFDVIKNSCTSISYWLLHALVAVYSFRNWSYGVVGIMNDQNALDYVLTAISRQNLKKRIEKVESTISEVKNSPLLSVTMIHRSRITPRDLEYMLCDETADPMALPLALLKVITNGFSPEQKIGEGGFAVVYKGKLENKTIAVKRMSNALMDENVFHREIHCLMRAKHKNIVRFIGYCADRQGIMETYEGNLVMADVHQRLLCFQYLPKGSLHEYIVDTSRISRWRDCYQIITGICEGLHYLHQKKIAHLDLKPANILLDDNLVAKISDFGLSRCFIGENESQVISKIAGTTGYLAPELLKENSKVKYRNLYHADIYSLGVVIMEILNGEKKEYHVVDDIVERWSNKFEQSQRDEQMEQIRVCVDIGIKCTNFEPVERPNTQHIINILDGRETTDENTNTGVITSQQAENAPDELDQGIPNTPGETSSMESVSEVTLPCNSIWEYTANLNKLNETMHSLSPDIRRCFEFCGIFPRGSKLRGDELVRLWIAQGYVKTSCATDDMEDIARGYIQELVSCSFLQPIETRSDTDCFTIPDVLHDILDKVAGNCFRIENGGEGWEGDVPRHTQHLFIQNYAEELITHKVLGLETLCTLIVYVVAYDTPLDEIVINSICKRLPKLVLAFAFSQEHELIETPIRFSVPESVGQLKYLRYLAFRTRYHSKTTLPSTLNKLQHIQLLDFGNGSILQFTGDKLVNLRHLFCSEYVKLPYIGKLSSLQTLRGFTVSNTQGCELKQLRNLNKLRGSLHIYGLRIVKDKGQALEANLAAKRLTNLKLSWYDQSYTRCSPEVEADVVEGLCPPLGLKKLMLEYYEGWRYPDWMMGSHNDGPKNLQKLYVNGCRVAVPFSGLAEAFPHLRRLVLYNCSWDALSDNMVHLTSLKDLRITYCENIRSLPSLPQSLKKFTLFGCNGQFMESCKTVGHPNWQKIEHIPKKYIS